MDTPPVPLAMLLTRDVSYEWHDAVALVAQLIAQSRANGPVTRLPEFRLLALEANGTVSSFSPEPSAPAMPGAALLLQQLLSGKEQPTPLRLYAMQAATSDPTPPIDAFVEEIAKFERPGRVAQLAALYARAFDRIGAVELANAAHDRLERPLTLKTQAPTAVKAPKHPATKRREHRRSAASTVVVVVALAAAAGGAAWYVVRQRPAPVQPPAATGEAEPPATEPLLPSRPVPQGVRPPSSTAPLASPARGTARVRATAAVVSAETQMARAREFFARQEYAAASAAIERVIEMLGTENSPQAQELRRIALSLAEVARAAVAERAVAASRIYRSGDPGVSDPVPLSHLPPKPDPSTPPALLQVLELDITPDGQVDSAKFVMNRPSFRNSWWTSAAKAWRFEPALKDGQPVRFSMRIVMDDSAR